MAHAIGFAEAPFESAAEADPGEMRAAAAVPDHDLRRGEGRRLDRLPGAEIFERLHGIGAKLQAGARLLEESRLFEHGCGVAGASECESGGKPGDSAAGDQN